MRRIAFALLASSCFCVSSSLAQETPQDIIAAHVRLQGFSCDTPISATRDRRASRPEEAVWILDCGADRYRVRLIPHLAAVIEPL